MTRSFAAGAAFLWLTAVGLQPLSSVGQTRPAREDPNSGPSLYRAYCASCHGTVGKGDGPVARTLTVPLPDLTTIAKRGGGVFPSADVARIIDGRTPLSGHLRDGMPLWGAVLNRMEAQDERAVQARIAAMVSHLESLQMPPIK